MIEISILLKSLWLFENCKRKIAILMNAKLWFLKKFSRINGGGVVKVSFQWNGATAMAFYDQH